MLINYSSDIGAADLSQIEDEEEIYQSKHCGIFMIESP